MRTEGLVASKDLRQLEAIEVKKVQLSHIPDSFPALQRIQNEAHFYHIHHTVAIEGNSLSVSEIRHIIETGLSVAGDCLIGLSVAGDALTGLSVAGDALTGLSVAGCSYSVSYTHLDVYKRQVLCCTITSVCCTITSVLYHHLSAVPSPQCAVPSPQCAVPPSPQCAVPSPQCAVPSPQCCTITSVCCTITSVLSLIHI
ncbi:hypothetical protein HAZT_HAZT008539 [Hyalella azteca]|uniref:Uncharacterized protein n=1 Tax=Hyalella azteca TaxID=294128 RepID=A0A6A0HAQ6_HYAAZ|nr:hypothetical protein HAZT_HAZT008539 [Hyalella azteca]